MPRAMHGMIEPMDVPLQEPLALDDAVSTLPGIGAKRAESLAALNIGTIRQLLGHFPRAYADRSAVTPIAEAVEGETVTILAEVVSARQVRMRGRMSQCVAVLRDDSGTMRATWFGRGFLAKALTPGLRGYLTGLVGTYNGPALKNPEYEWLTGDEAADRLHSGRVVPVYRSAEGLGQRFLRSLIHETLERYAAIWDDGLPNVLLREHGLPNAVDAIRAVHFPANPEEARRARDRFAYEELLGIQVGLLRERAARRHEESGIAHRPGGPHFAALRQSLPFRLTGGQEKAVAALIEDMAAPRPMFRLLQGDVGCGKTVVALHAAAVAADGGYQTAFMAPTEILAEQHAYSLRTLLEPLGLRVAVLTGSTGQARAWRRRIAAGDYHVVVGTHALFQNATVFHKLGLVIIDEQHRFGVMQRGALAEKGARPDVVQMTATPIPRTLAITVYGGMDLTIIDELPPGRTPVKTRWIRHDKVDDLHAYIVEQTREGRQTYYVCPLIEDSDKVEWTAVTRHFEELSATAFSGLRTGLLHGRMQPHEKEAAMNAFKAGETDVLFATTVIEVGVDVPNASIMVIENADRFGLTQLHQLRGRVGRGAEESYCFLLGEPKTKDGRRRIKVMCKTNSGFDIAEEDLNLRGPGEFAGVRQAGLTDLRFADLIRDVRLLDRARGDAEAILSRDPSLAEAEHGPLARAAAAYQALQA